MGGIGSVFTHPAHRGRGHATALLQQTARIMIERGMEVSLLFGVRPMYPALGWKPWGATARLLYSRVPRRGGVDICAGAARGVGDLTGHSTFS